MIIHERTQHPVGQGFFHTGSLCGDSNIFHYIYDCGSENRAVLQQEIEAYLRNANRRSSAGPPPAVDALFVSHLDSDHVNGLDFLLARIPVSTVILPHLSPFERIFLAAKGSEAGEAGFTDLLLWCDPVAWFMDRGVKRVILVDGPDDSEEAELELPIDFERRPTGPIHLDFDYLETQAQRVDQRRVRGAAVVNLLVQDRIPLPVLAGAGRFNWVFLTFVHPETKRMAGFRRAIRRHFGRVFVARSAKYVPIETNWLLGILREPSERKKLAEAYTAIRRDRNLTSMSLYSGPVAATSDSEHVRLEHRGPYSFYAAGKVGWLGTGDADLRVATRRSRFMNHFASVRPQILTIALPHHGSHRNFHQDLLSLNGTIYYVAAGAANSYGHPHPDVADHVSKRSQDGLKELIVVSEKPRTELTEWCYF